MAEFTIEGKGRWMKIFTPCKISAIPNKESKNTELTIETESAQWDTGSMVTIVSENIVHALKLVKTGVTTISGFDGKAVKANTYLVNISFPGNLETRFVEVVAAPLISQDVLVGMDIISECNFQYSILEGKSRLIVSRNW